MRTASWTDSVSVLDRITAVLEAFGDDDVGLGISVLARRANLPKSTVSRIAADLVEQRCLDKEGGKLYLGPRLFEMGQTVEQPRRLRQLALPVMADLRDTTGCTVAVALLDREDVVVVATVRGRDALRTRPNAGGRMPAHATALGKAILAYSSDEDVQQVLRGQLRRRTPRTTCEPVRLRQELDVIRSSRIATDSEEWALGVASVASPILGADASALAAVAVIAPVDGRDRDTTATAVRVAAITLSRRIDAAGGL